MSSWGRARYSFSKQSLDPVKQRVQACLVGVFEGLSFFLTLLLGRSGFSVFLDWVSLDGLGFLENGAAGEHGVPRTIAMAVMRHRGFCRLWS